MAKEWAAVSAAMKSRLEDLEMTQAELIQRSELAPMTIRELLFNSAQRRRSSQTLGAVSEALGWPAGHLQAIAEGRDPADPDAGDPVLTELGELRKSLAAITDRLDVIERRLDDK
jgi:hypothetical protein